MIFPPLRGLHFTVCLFGLFVLVITPKLIFKTHLVKFFMWIRSNQWKRRLNIPKDSGQFLDN